MDTLTITDHINSLLSEDPDRRKESFEYLDVIDPSLLLEMLPEIDWEQRKEVASILIRKKEKIIPGIRKKLALDNEDIKFWCIQILGDIDCAESVDMLADIIEKEKLSLKKSAVESLCRKTDVDTVLPAVVKTLYIIDWSINSLAKNYLVDHIEIAGEFLLNRCLTVEAQKKLSLQQINLLSWCITIFGITRYRNSMSFLLKMLGNRKLDLDLYVVESLCRIGDSGILEKVIEFLKDSGNSKDWFIVQKTLIYLRDLDISKHIPFFITYLGSPEWGIQQSASELLMKYSEHNTDFFITALNQNPGRSYRYWIPRILSGCTGKKAVNTIHSLLMDSGNHLNDYVQIETAGIIGDESTLEILVRLFNKTELWFLRKKIIDAIGNLKFLKSQPFLKIQLQHENYHIRSAAAEAIKKLS